MNLVSLQGSFDIDMKHVDSKYKFELNCRYFKHNITYAKCYASKIAVSRQEPREEGNITWPAFVSLIELVILLNAPTIGYN